MSIWDSLRKLLGRKPSPSTSITDKPTTTNVPTGSNSAAIDLPNGGQPNPGDTPVDLIRLLFNRKDKHQTTMLNSISLSTDMKTLYLIDNGRAISFDLTVPEGVLVGLLGKQLVVATGVSVPSPGGPVPEGGGGGEKPVAETGGVKPQKAAGKVHTFKASKDSQFTLTYNEDNGVMAVIGFDDIIMQLDHPDDDRCAKAAFSIKKGKIVRIKLTEDIISFEEI